MLRELARLPAAEFDASVACPVLGKDFATVEDACEQLVDAHLLHVADTVPVDGRIRYRLHGLQRAYARGLAASR